MDAIDTKAWQRVPLAEAVLTLWRFVADDKRLEELFEQHRGRCYTKILTFPTLVHLMNDALMLYRGSGRASFERAAESGELPVSIRSTFGKLARVPLKLSKVFLASGSDRLRELAPVTKLREPPASLRELRVITLDGKAIKGVVKRLKVLRGRSGGALGGRGLVAMDFQTGQVVDTWTDPDGDANDVKFVPQLVPRVRERIPGPRPWMADRQFADLIQTAHFAQNGDHFLVRYNKKVPFYQDPARPARQGEDASGRTYFEDWGWIGKPTPQATVFQFAFCLLLYNMIEAVRSTIARSVDRDPETISMEKLFIDVQRELTACTVTWDVEQLAARVDRPWRAGEVRQRLKQLLGHAWTDRWIKAKSYRRRPHPAVPHMGVHMSVHRILMEAKQLRAANPPP